MQGRKLLQGDAPPPVHQIQFGVPLEQLECNAIAQGLSPKRTYATAQFDVARFLVCLVQGLCHHPPMISTSFGCFHSHHHAGPQHDHRRPFVRFLRSNLLRSVRCIEITLSFVHPPSRHCRHTTPPTHHPDRLASLVRSALHCESSVEASYAPTSGTTW